MKKLSKLLALALALVLALSLAACGGNNDTPSTTDTPSTDDTPDTTPDEPETPSEPETPAEPETPENPEEPAAPADGETYTVGICQLAPHPALDLATQGFKEALTAALGDRVTFDEQNAGGEDQNCATIVGGFVANDVDLIMANATSPLQAAAAATSEIPILGTSVTEYGTALGIADFSGTVGGNISGTSDLAPLDQQAQMIKDIFPDAQKVGLLYCSGEPNSIYQVTTVKGYLENMGLTAELYAFTDVNDLPAVTQNACDNSDVIYIPTDNTAANNTETIANIVLAAKIPVVAGEEGICKGCGCVTLSISYYDIGYKTGEMAAQILTGEADISTMPIAYAPQFTKEYNAANCEALNVTVPDDFVAIAE